MASPEERPGAETSEAGEGSALPPPPPPRLEGTDVSGVVLTEGGALTGVRPCEARRRGDKAGGEGYEEEEEEDCLASGVETSDETLPIEAAPAAAAVEEVEEEEEDVIEVDEGERRLGTGGVRS